MGLTIRPGKCQMSEVQYLGPRVGGRVLTPVQGKVEAITGWPTYKTGNVLFRYSWLLQNVCARFGWVHTELDTDTALFPSCNFQAALQKLQP